MNSLINNLKALGTGRLIALGVVGAGLVLALVFGLSAVTKPTFKSLYTGLSPSSASDIVTALEQGGFQVEISADSSVVSVPQGDMARARMVLAENNLPGEGAPGWEIFDQGGSLGMNTFLQKVNSRRALEGELARSIQTIKGIDAARVHLVLPEREAFSRERTKPTASVILTTNMSFSMDNKQAYSIQHLVGSAVPNLSPSQVTVMTNRGEIIAAEDGDGSSSDVTLQSVRSALEDRYARNIEKILTARVGTGNARVQVTVDVSSERRVVVQESFNPQEQVVRSTETSNLNEEDMQADNSNVSVENNLPENLMQDGAATPTSRNTRQETNEIVNYEIGSTRSETVYEPGDVQKISVAVLVNGIYERADGTVDYNDRTPDELALLEELVKTAIGFEQARGDSVSVESLRFIDYSMDVGEPIGISMLDIITENIMTIIKWIFVSLIVLFVMLFGIRPTLQRIFPAVISERDDDGLPEDGAGERTDVDQTGAVSPAQQGAKLPQADTSDDSVNEMSTRDEDLINVMSVQGGVRKRRIKALGDMVDSDNEETLKIVRTWIAGEV